jgi:hypothetical protein
MFLLDYHTIIWNMITKWEFPQPATSKVALGSLLMLAGTWIIKGRNLVKKAVS